MAVFGNKSKEILSACHPDLIVLMNEVIEHVDVSIICGYRDKWAQNQAYLNGFSKQPWPQSKHNKLPSYAFDFQPYPNSTKKEDYIFIAGIIIGIALKLKAEGTIISNIRYGGDFNMNDRVSDDGWDFGHIEIF